MPPVPQIFTLSNLTIALMLGLVAFTAQKMYQMVNPVTSADIPGPKVDPLWKENQEFDMLCFFSLSSRFKSLNVSQLRENGQIIYEEHSLLFNKEQATTTVNLSLDDDTSNINNELNNNHKAAASHTGRAHLSSKIWEQLHANKSSVYLHVVLTSGDLRLHKKTHSSSSRESSSSVGDLLLTADAVRQGVAALHGAVKMIKYDKIPKQFRQRYLLSDLGLVDVSPEDARKLAMHPDSVMSYWKPEVAIKIVNDLNSYPMDHVPNVIYKNVIPDRAMIQRHNDRNRIKNKNRKRGGGGGDDEEEEDSVTLGHYRPSLFVDEIGLTSDKYIPLNSSVHALPLKISFEPLSVQRWILMSHLEESLQAQQSEMGFTEKDLDDVRRLVSETSLSLLGFTMLASLLHLLFEFLAFRSDINFWQENKSLAGLSARSVVTELISQFIVFLFLVESDTSLLVTIPTFAAILVQVWKVKKATGLTVSLSGGIQFTRWSTTSTPTGDRDAAAERTTSTPTSSAATNTSDNSSTTNTSSEEEDKNKKKDDAVVAPTVPEGSTSEETLVEVTLEADRFASVYLSAILLPLIIGYTTYSLVYEKHTSWYSWAIGASTGFVYAFGFVLMCPQLYINHKLKSVSHLPWKALIYKFLNTFIDDLFAFIIKMPTMHRLSVFRDDIVFVIYLYQRWIYRVDNSRPTEK